MLFYGCLRLLGDKTDSKKSRVYKKTGDFFTFFYCSISRQIDPGRNAIEPCYNYSPFEKQLSPRRYQYTRHDRRVISGS